MSAGRLRPLQVPGPSPVHGLAPHVKVLATLLFVVAVVCTPRRAVWAFGVHAALVVAVGRLGRVPLRAVLPRLAVELPFVAFALALPFVARGPRVEVLGVALSVDGLWAAWNVVAKGVLGLAAALVLVATTPVPDLLRGVERLGAPPAFTAVAGSMLRYLEVVAGEMRRLQVARISRAHDPRWIWQARAVAATAGTLFVRTYERGERVHLAMVSRGWEGRLPAWRPEAPVGPAAWAAALAVPAVAALVVAAALVGWGP